jgi:hypothetical protein
MATKTLGTTAQTSLTALKYLPGYASGMSAADQAAIQNAVKDDLGNAHSLVPGAFQGGRLFIPNRGILQVLPGDWVGVDSQGWPILVSANSIANAAWTHS